MILKKLTVKKLHGSYDYTVRFHDDLTFLYGENGCGKTTILNIISSIVTGELYALSEYKFDTITLVYYDTAANRSNTLCIKSADGAYRITLNKQEKSETIPIFGAAHEYMEEESVFSLRQKYMRSYEFPLFLRKSFDYLYLPLSRNFQGEAGMLGAPYHYRSSAYSDRTLAGKSYLNDSLLFVTDLIRKACLRISAEENTINTKFRKSVLSSALKIPEKFDLDNLLASVSDEESLKKIELGRKEYIETLESIGECDPEMQQSIDSFFSKYETLFQQTQRAKKEGRMSLSVELLLMSTEFNRIQEVASLAQGFEKEKERAREPIATFDSTVNRFFDYGNGKKRASISSEGKLTVEDVQAGRIVPLTQLSSGEKQLLIIFSFLLFGLSPEQRGIYMIDEPEASLHLAWQKDFVESIRRANPSLQLILATHSPEIISRYADHAVHLEKKINPSSEPEEELFDE